jgi:hypothetical protein
VNFANSFDKSRITLASVTFGRRHKASFIAMGSCLGSARRIRNAVQPWLSKPLVSRKKKFRTFSLKYRALEKPGVQRTKSARTERPRYGSARQNTA